MDEKVMVDGVKRVVSKLLARRKLKRSYEYEVQWEGQPSSSDYTAWLSRDRSVKQGSCAEWIACCEVSLIICVHLFDIHCLCERILFQAATACNAVSCMLDRPLPVDGMPICSEDCTLIFPPGCMRVIKHQFVLLHKSQHCSW